MPRSGAQWRGRARPRVIRRGMVCSAARAGVALLGGGVVRSGMAEDRRGAVRHGPDCNGLLRRGVVNQRKRGGTCSQKTRR